MAVQSKDIIEHFETEDRSKEEQKAVVASVIATIEEEIEMIGIQRIGRQERHAKALAAAMQECDSRADYLIRRKDQMNELMEKMNGDHPGPIALLPGDVRVIDQKPRRRSLFGRRETQARTI